MFKKTMRVGFYGLATLILPNLVFGQAKRAFHGPPLVTAAVPATRYFQITMVLKFPGNELPEPRTQSITTQLAVFSDRPGSSKTRMTSQIPVTIGGTTKYMELGTKLDCNDVHIEGGKLALSIVMETSMINGTVVTKNGAGTDVEEPLISARNLVLAARLPMDTPETIFDSNSKNMDTKSKSLGTTQPNSFQITEQVSAPTLQIEMTAHELK